jgi:hypothetical protein
MRKISLFKLCLIAITCITPLAFSETYTWTDKQGKKHFGDEIPKEYISQGKIVDTKSTNTIPSVVTPHNNTTNSNKTAQFIEVPNSSPKTSSNCEKQKDEYLSAQRCYNKCRLVGGGINKAKCADCKDVKKPAC